MQATGGTGDGFRLFPAVMVLALVFLALGQLHLLREVRGLRKERAKESLLEVVAQENGRSPYADERSAAHEDDIRHSGASSGFSGQGAVAPLLVITSLEQRVNELSRAIEHPRGARAVVEYNVMSPPVETEIPEAAVLKRSWGEEQILGPPDTATASDASTAWASREQDAGPEWLQVEFENPVDVAEVRIRETFNPGAISKVTGMVNGQEVVLWEGTATGGTAPRDFVVPVQGHLQANSVVVHLDTARVPGWNEIDAVELVGKDGSRQWARSANASSSYADGRRTGTTQSDLQGRTRILSR